VNLPSIIVSQFENQTIIGRLLLSVKYGFTEKVTHTTLPDIEALAQCARQESHEIKGYNRLQENP
jgi:hypothetical protein